MVFGKVIPRFPKLFQVTRIVEAEGSPNNPGDTPVIPDDPDDPPTWDNPTTMFEDYFSGTTIDSNKWTINGVPAINSGILECIGNNEGVASKSTGVLSAGKTFSFEAYLKANRTGNDYVVFGLMSSAASQRGMFIKCEASGATWTFKTRDDIDEETTDITVVNNTYYKLKIVVTTTGAKCYLNDVLQASHTTRIYLDDLYCVLGAESANNTLLVDWVKWGF